MMNDVIALMQALGILSYIQWVIGIAVLLGLLKILIGRA